jgi:hypothetical protein
MSEGSLQLAAGALLQATPEIQRDQNSWQIVLWVVVLIALTAILGWVILALRKRLLEQAAADDDHAGLVEQMRRLKSTGQISQAEFDAAKKKWALQVQAQLRSSDPSGKAQPKPGEKGTGNRQRQAAPSPGAARARPGFDLTGEPLPPPSPEQ